MKERLEKEDDDNVRDALLDAIQKIGVQTAELPFDNRLRLLAENNAWEDIRDVLEQRPTENVVEALKIDQPLVRRTARYVLMKRTGKYDLGENYDAWSKWWKSEGKTADTGR